MQRIAEAWFGHTLARAAVVVGCLATLARCDGTRSGGAAGSASIGRTAPAVVQAVPVAADLRGADASPHARRVANWAVQTNDHGARPFAVIDKQSAEVLVFSASGVLIGALPALLGSARGDDTAPGVGDKAIDAVLPHERLASADAADNRISYGCVNLPQPFFDAVALPAFHRAAASSTCFRNRVR